MAKRGFFRRIVDAVLGRQPPAKDRPSFGPIFGTPPGPEPAPSAPSGFVSEQDKEDVISHMRATLGFVNDNTVRRGVDLMTPREIRWAKTATASQLRAAARRDASRVMVTTDGGEIPVNPFWYN